MLHIFLKSSSLSGIRENLFSDCKAIPKKYDVNNIRHLALDRNYTYMVYFYLFPPLSFPFLSFPVLGGWVNEGRNSKTEGHTHARTHARRHRILLYIRRHCIAQIILHIAHFMKPYRDPVHL